MVDEPAQLRRLPQGTTHLHIQGITGADIRRLSRLRQLTHLEVSSRVLGPQVGDEVLAEIAGLHTLTHVSLTNWHGTGVALPALAALPRLRGLRIAFTRITPEGVRKIGQLPQLTELCA